MWNEYVNAASLDEVVDLLASGGTQTRVIAGGTDIILELERGARKGVTQLVDISRVPEINQITLDEDRWLHLGPMVTHNQCVASGLIREYAIPLAQACWEVGSPQNSQPRHGRGQPGNCLAGQRYHHPLDGPGSTIGFAFIQGREDRRDRGFLHRRSPHGDAGG